MSGWCFDHWGPRGSLPTCATCGHLADECSREAAEQTRRAAFEQAKPKGPRLRGEVEAAIRAHPATCDELEQRLGLTHQCCSARVHELMAAGRIVAMGKRATRSGRLAVVWKVRGPCGPSQP